MTLPEGEDGKERSKPKQFVQATFWVTAQVAPYPGYEDEYIRHDHAEVLLEQLWDDYQPDRGKSFVVTHASVDGDVLKVVCTYSARGANADDARRRINGAAKKVWRLVVGKAAVTRK